MSSVLLARLSSEVPQTVADKTAALTQRRISGEPLEYICGKAGFFGMELFVSPDVLIPQSDTEVVCEQALARLARGGRVADICCGSGNIALALMRERDVFADMFDSSPAALVVAKKTLRLVGFSEKARLLCRAVFSDGFFDGCDKYDLIVSNPPYIRTDVIETLSKDVQSEPRAALDGGYDGLRFYRRLLAICPVMLKAGGVMIFEIGFDQKTADCAPLLSFANCSQTNGLFISATRAECLTVQSRPKP
jgi:release factor glutamine methyltransferase